MISQLINFNFSLLYTSIFSIPFQHGATNRVKFKQFKHTKMSSLNKINKTMQADRAPKCQGNIGGIGHFLLIVEPYITKLAGPKNYRGIMDGSEKIPAQPVGINPDTGNSFTDREKNDRYKLLQIYLD